MLRPNSATFRTVVAEGSWPLLRCMCAMPMTGKQRAFHEIWPRKNKARACGRLSLAHAEHVISAGPASRAALGNNHFHTLQESAFIGQPDSHQPTSLQCSTLLQNLLTQSFCSSGDSGKSWARYFELPAGFAEIVPPRAAFEKKCSGPLLAKRALRPNTQQHGNDCALYRCFPASVKISSTPSPRRHFICGWLLCWQC